jgi:hypothetical protein
MIDSAWCCTSRLPASPTATTTSTNVPTKQDVIGRAGYRALVAGWMIAFEDSPVDVSLQLIAKHTVQIDFIGHGIRTHIERHHGWRHRLSTRPQ